MRSDSVAPSISGVRNSPTRAQRGTRPKIKLFFIPNLKHYGLTNNFMLTLS
ncbi:MAG: hypothetical protein NZ455_06965 [Bacteroidia bacterium]|nr:hypothetical protein [Bacteroidia bacterium]MDW8346601.1 hypothetical protein [Bacteroidia bacterium]